MRLFREITLFNLLAIYPSEIAIFYTSIAMPFSNNSCDENELDENNSEAASDLSLMADISDNEGETNPVETKELLSYREDNVAFCVDEYGNPCDEGAVKLDELGEIPRDLNYRLRDVTKMKRSSRKFYFALCVKESEEGSLAIFKNYIYIERALLQLREIVLEKKVS
ncbi:hypothetical protein QAD02_011770 [Eretmocerus hayati]|uniref:Uncharacterized protein n=1 Tax=Eretmocerus hayati TaxID=131215 RepID=A0ACC2NXG6_9HYME|nr:hypothetical protein QAD02_011770 [Eretmocerus hayati]